MATICYTTKMIFQTYNNKMEKQDKVRGGKAQSLAAWSSTRHTLTSPIRVHRLNWANVFLLNI